MVHFEKSQPAPECLAIEKEKNNGDYNCGDVLSRLQEDFKNKCYICEDSEITNIEIEHFKPKSKYPYLTFEWENLFFSCGYCNGIKSNDYDNILDCTKKEHQVDVDISYQIKIVDFTKGKIIIKALKEEEIIKNTVDLLLKVHQPENATMNKKIASDNLRNKILKEITIFETYIEKYLEAKKNNDTNEIQKLKNIIEIELQNSSKFTAFKRWIVKENEEILQDFIQNLE